MKCQATFKKHCQYPKCDCDRPVNASAIREFLLTEKGQEIADVLDGPEQECYPLCVKGMTKETCPYNPKLGCDCGANAAYTAKMYPDNGDFYVTGPQHGGKVTCYKCNGFIVEKDDEPYWEYPDKKKILAHFHKDCYNPYEHYYGLDKPID